MHCLYVLYMVGVALSESALYYPLNRPLLCGGIKANAKQLPHRHSMALICGRPATRSALFSVPFIAINYLYIQLFFYLCWRKLVSCCRLPVACCQWSLIVLESGVQLPALFVCPICFFLFFFWLSFCRTANGSLGLAQLNVTGWLAVSQVLAAPYNWLINQTWLIGVKARRKCPTRRKWFRLLIIGCDPWAKITHTPCVFCL